MTWRRRTTARRGIKAVIPEPSDQAEHRKRRGSRGGRPVAYDTVEYKRWAGIERGIDVLKQWRGIATATTSTPSLPRRRRPRRHPHRAAMTLEALHSREGSRP
jgi:hypothetical protein